MLFFYFHDRLQASHSKTSALGGSPATFRTEAIHATCTCPCKTKHLDLYCIPKQFPHVSFISQSANLSPTLVVIANLASYPASHKYSFTLHAGWTIAEKVCKTPAVLWEGPPCRNHGCMLLSIIICIHKHRSDASITNTGHSCLVALKWSRAARSHPHPELCKAAVRQASEAASSLVLINPPPPPSPHPDHPTE